MKLFFRKCLAAFVVGVVALSARPEELKLGVQTWTLRNLSFDQVIDFCQKHQIKYVELIPDHIGLNGSKEDWQKKKEAMEKAGLIPYTFGVAGLRSIRRRIGNYFRGGSFFG